MSSRKLGDVAIGILVLAFVITGFSLLFFSLDESTGIDSGIVKSGLSTTDSVINSNDGIQDMTVDLTVKTDDTGSFKVEEGTSSDIETRGADTGGVFNLLSKNIIVNFLNEVSKTAPFTTNLIKWFLLLASIVISILFIRFFWGDNKI